MRSIEPQTMPRSRRAVLAASIAGIASLITSTLARPDDVSAGSDGDVVLGANNVASTTTRITVSEAGVTAVEGVATSGRAVAGRSGSGPGVYAASSSGSAIQALSTSGQAVRAQSAAADQAAVLGWSSGDAVGVLGYSGGPSIPSQFSKTGVYGAAEDPDEGVGVLGVAGHAGVEGRSGSGVGVSGRSSTGTAVRGQSAAQDREAILGWSSGWSTGVLGYSGSQPTVTAVDFTGVYGYANVGTSPTGVLGRSPKGVGVIGETETGRGVSGSATAATGVTYGVYGRADSSQGTGVRGFVSSPTGATYGVDGRSDSIGGFGVRGWAKSSTGAPNGVYGQVDSNGTGAAGVRGFAPATSGETRGVVGVAASPSGNGVRGWATAASGVSYGVWGQTNSPSGFGVWSQGRLGTSSWLQLSEIPDPPISDPSTARVFVRDNGLGKGELCVRFASGGAIVIAAEL